MALPLNSYIMEPKSDKSMDDKNYNELFRAIGKEAFANMIKADIRRRVPEPIASMYIKQFEDIKNLADYLEFVARQMKGQ